jgi:hypothetical protein
MTAARCSCGFTELADEELNDHLLRVFEPEDRTGNDGLAHEERNRLTCACGLTASTPEELDTHFLKVFTTDDAIGSDGHRHEPVVTKPSCTGGNDGLTSRVQQRSTAARPHISMSD